MRRLCFVVPVIIALSAGCSSRTVEERLDYLESQDRHYSVLDTRLAQVESQVGQMAGDIGGIKDRLKTPKERREEQHRARELAAAAAEPQVTGVVELQDILVPDTAVAGADDSSYQQALAHLSQATGIPVAESGSAAAQPRKVEPRPIEPKKVEPRPVEPRKVDPAPTATQQPKAVTASKAQSGYNAALSLYRQGQYTKADGLFAAFMQSSPKSPLAANALYWRGECAYSLAQYDQAILFFKDVVSRYPQHDKAAAALLKAGYSYAHLNDMENARFYWQILLDDFPNSAPAQLARRRLASSA